MSTQSYSVILLGFVCCAWPLAVHAVLLWIARRDWSASGDLLSRLFSIITRKEED